MFDSPFEFCRVCGGYVLLDQTQRECAAEHRCRGVACQLLRCFTGRDFRPAPLPAAAPAARRRRA
jgi:hypothetical protein